MAEIRPQKGPQEAFLSTKADIAVYGGAAGGGKTWTLVVEPTRHIKKTKDFGAVIFRRTVPEITNEGGLWDESCNLYPGLGATGLSGTHDWRFPPYGNTISMAGLENVADIYKWHSSQICCLEFDELTTFAEKQFWYMLSRNRSKCGIRPYVRAGCNPEPNWVKYGLLAPWVDEDFKGPRAQSGELRWMVRIDGKVHWVDEGHPDAQSVTFIRASVYDNKILLERDPEYLKKLKSQGRVERARLLDGDWSVRFEGLVYPEAFDPQYGVLVEREGPRGGVPDEGGMDFGVKAPFVALWGYVDYDDVLWVVGERYASGITIPQHSRSLLRGIRWWCDPAGTEEWVQLKQGGHDTRPCVHKPTRGATGEVKHPKRSGIDMVLQRMRTGRLKIVRPRCPNLVRELGLYIYDPEKPDLEEPLKQDDHAPDALRYWVVGHDRNRYVADETVYETEEERLVREQSERAAEYSRLREDDLRAQRDPFDPRWWHD